MPEVRPNLLFLMTDQQRFDALSCHDGWIRTPNLDRLAAEGADLRQHFSQAPVCVPSRCSLFSGRYTPTHGVLENNVRLPGREVHLLKALRQQGYHLSYAGKNHFLPEAEMRTNLDRYYPQGHVDSITPLRQAYLDLEKESHDHLFQHDSFGTGRYHDFPDTVTTSGLIAERSIEDLALAPTDQPWCVVSSFSDPHVPHVAPRRFAGWYPEDEVPLPDWSPGDAKDEPHRIKVKRGVQHVDRADDAAKRHYLAVYGSMCSYVDELMGCILDALSNRPDAARTIVVFVSDHGDFCWHRGMVKKDLVLYDDLIHVPALVRWPGHIAPQVVEDVLTEHVDLLPTLLDLMAIPVPTTCQGRSLAGLLAGGKAVISRDVVYAAVCYPWMRNPFATAEAFRDVWERDQVTGGPLAGSAPFNVPGDHTQSVRTMGWKYIWYVDGFEELFDLVADPDEGRNLATDPAYTAALSDMRQRLKAWQEKTAPDGDAATEARHRETFDRWDFTHSVPPPKHGAGG